MTGWQVLDERVLVEQPPWLTVKEQDVRLPGGQTLRNYIMLDLPDGCLIFAITPDGRALLLEQYRHGRGAREVGLPSGFIDGDEPPLETAKRELLEETGYAGDDWISLGALFTNSNRGTQLFHFFLARDVRPIRGPEREASERDITMRLKDLNELRAYLARSNGDIGMAAMTGILLGMAELERMKR